MLDGTHRRSCRINELCDGGCHKVTVRGNVQHFHRNGVSLRTRAVRRAQAQSQGCSHATVAAAAGPSSIRHSLRSLRSSWHCLLKQHPPATVTGALQCGSSAPNVRGACHKGSVSVPVGIRVYTLLVRCWEEMVCIAYPETLPSPPNTGQDASQAPATPSAPPPPESPPPGRDMMARAPTHQGPGEPVHTTARLGPLLLPSPGGDRATGNHSRNVRNRQVYPD